MLIDMHTSCKAMQCRTNFNLDNQEDCTIRSIFKKIILGDGVVDPLQAIIVSWKNRFSYLI